MRLVLLGSGAFGLPTFRHLASKHEVLAVVSQPDRPAGRGGKMTPTPVAQWALGALSGVALVRPENVNQPEVRDAVRALDADAWVVIAFGQKLSQPLLADRFSINLHASLLPRWRGAAPIHHAILAGDTVTGNSVITLAERMDAGLVLGRSERAIEPTQTTGDLHDLLAEDGADLVERVLTEHDEGRLNSVEQDERLVTIAGKLSRADAAIDFSLSADEVRRRINGLSPWPGVSVETDERPARRIKLVRAKAEPGSHDQDVGVVLDGCGGLIACGSGTVLRLLEVQPAGRKPMRYADFALGTPPADGVRMVSVV